MRVLFLGTQAFKLLKQTYRERASAILPSNHQQELVFFFARNRIANSDHARAPTPTCNLRHKSFTPGATQIVNCGRISSLIFFCWNIPGEHLG